MKPIVKWSVVCLVLSGCGPCSTADDVEEQGEPGVLLEAGVCGDGVKGLGEACDGDCPESDAACEMEFEGDACMTSVLVGSAASCSARCEITAQLVCVDADGCCPSGCSAQFDSDCVEPDVESMCGNGMIEQGESCDGDCPMSDAACDDLNACTTDSVMGDAAMCQAMCVGTPITACMSGDGCCPAGCDEGQDDDCAQVEQCGVMVSASSQTAPASIITSYKLLDGAQGVDFTGDGEIDNSYGAVLDQLGPSFGFTLEDDRDTYAEQIEDGELALIFEYEGLEGLKGPATFSINAFRGEALCEPIPDEQGANLYTRATNPNASRLDEVSIDASGQVQGRGVNELVLPVNMGRLTIDVGFAQARILAEVDASRSALPGKGVALTRGIIAGYARVDEVADGINDAIAACGCEGVSDVLLRGNVIDGFTCAIPDSGQVECTGVQSGACEFMVDNCNVFSSLISQLADIDASAPESDCELGVTCDSVSMTFGFEAAGARIIESP